jgi:hypothetical protein
MEPSPKALPSFTGTDTPQPQDSDVTALQKRLRLAHQARRAKEHQLDGIRRALCDAGFMEDDDPYGHADLEDVIRQAVKDGS